MDIVDARINWESPDRRYRVALWGKNLSDEVERLGGTPVGGLFAFAAPTRPREWGLTLTARFGQQ